MAEHERRDDAGGWVESQEGDLDPDLAIEGEYRDWDDASARPFMPLLVRVVGLLLLVALIGAIVLPALI